MKESNKQTIEQLKKENEDSNIAKDAENAKLKAEREQLMKELEKARSMLIKIETAV